MIFSAQIWSDFCKRMSPIKYVLSFAQCTTIYNIFRYVDVLFIDDETDDEHDEQYIPEVLLPCYPKLEGEMTDSDSIENEYLSDDSHGTSEKDLITTVEVEIVDNERFITID